MKLNKTQDIPEGEVVESLVTRSTDMFDMTSRYVDRISEMIMPWPLPVLDKLILPLYLGQYILMQGRPGDAKTSFGIAIANMFGQEVKKRGPDFPYGPPLFVTSETTKQHMMLYLAMERLNVMGKPNSVTGKAWNIEDVRRGNYKKNELLAGAMRLSDLHIDLLGQDSEKKGQAIDIELAYRAVQELEAEGKRPLMLVMDYAQKMDALSSSLIKSRNDNDAQIFSEVDQFCVATRIPVILMAQSNEWVDDLEIPIGVENSIHGTSLAHRYAGAHFSLCRPETKKKWRFDPFTGDRPGTIDTGWVRYSNVPGLQIIRQLKQRDKNPYNAVLEVGFKFDVGRMVIEEIPEIDTNTIDLNDTMNYSVEELNGIAQAGFEFR